MIWIFLLYRLSPMWCNIDCSHLMSQFDCYQLQLIYLTLEHCPVKISSTKLHKPLLTHLIGHSTFSTPCTNLFLCFSCIFTFLEIIKSWMHWKFCIFSSMFNIKMAAQKFTNFNKYSFKCMLVWQLSQIQSNKIVLNEVKDS